MAQKPSIPKGTRDFNPEQVAKRNYIFNTIRNAFETFGFQPIETPSFENSSTLMGKYGDEGDRLIFKILNSGDYVKNIQSEIDEFAYFNNRIIFHLEGFCSKIDESFGDDIAKKSDLTELVNNLLSNELVNVYYDGIIKDFKFFMPDLYSEDVKYVFENKKNEIIEETILAIKNKSEVANSLAARISGDNSYEYKISDSFLRELYKECFGNNFNSNKLSNIISEKALRYDLTVPFARYVVQHQNEIDFPFKRYQIQPVWRADRPQKGRFREFYQCDADVVGSKSLWQEVEFIQLYDTVFKALKLEGVTIKINNRKILSGIAEVIGAKDKLIDFTVALDKLDKIGDEKVKEEMLGKGISQSGIDKLQPLFNLAGDFETQVKTLKSILSSSEEGLKGVEELEFINNAISELGLQTATLQLDVTLARGLNYYTGAIFEVAAPKTVQMGSIGGGGRYDNLTSIFSHKEDVSGVGISFGLDRIYLVLEELNLFPETVTKNVEVLFINFGEKEALFSLKAVKQLRLQGINAELYPDAAKMKKQMNYANKRNIPYVVLVGEQEIVSNTYTLKNMTSGEQETLSLEELIQSIK